MMSLFNILSTYIDKIIGLWEERRQSTTNKYQIIKALSKYVTLVG
jgi:hypothetical protein